MVSFTIDELTIPSVSGAPGWAEFARAIEVGNAVEEVGYGTADLAYEPEEELATYANPHEPHRLLVARVDGAIIARGVYETTVGDDADTAWLLTEVLPEHRGHGIGTALSDALESFARADGKAKALAYTPVRDDGGERIPSPTGFGWVAAASPDVAFLLQRGYRLEQVERVSRLPLPVDGLDRLVAEALGRSGPDYAIRTWEGSTPERWREDFAVLATRMSTDAPSAGLEEPDEAWTVERIIEADERHDRLNPRIRLRAAVEHLPSGHLVGFTLLSVPQQRHRAVDQYATLVMKEHRGHRLGMLLKVANLAHLDRVASGHPAVITFNAEENRHMLDVNEAVGFVPIASESAWRKDLEPRS